MHGGFDITFHEVIPEPGVLELVITELGKMRDSEGMHCSVVVSHVGPSPVSFDVHVELLSRNRHVGLTGYAVDADQYYALRQAFAALRDARAGAHVL